MGKYYRINQNIRADTVRVISDEGGQIGVMPLSEALTKAKAAGLDLIEVAAEAKPPVVKMIEFSKFKYQESKKDRAGKSGSGQENKEVHFSPFMAENDLQVKINKARAFLKDGDKVRLVVKFKGREITKKEFGEKLLNQAIETLSEDATVVEAPKLLGKMLMAQLKPKK